MPSREEQIAGGVYGLLVGDALGVPYEFHAPARIPPLEDIDLQPPEGFPRAHDGVPPGTWSDDGAQALCLLDSLLFRGQLDPEDLGRRLVNWLEWGYLAVDGQVFDVGIQTRTALASVHAGTPALLAGPKGEQDNGNGALMRVLPLALWHSGDDAKLAADAMTQSLVTHGHMRSQVCCALYCLWARRILKGEGVSDAWTGAAETFRQLHPEGTEARAELDTQVLPPGWESIRGTGTGYVVDCLRSARQCVVEHDSYEQVVKAAVRLGRDTDTTAAVAGGLAGLVHGVNGIPARWRQSLRGGELLHPMLQKLLRCAVR